MKILTPFDYAGQISSLLEMAAEMKAGKARGSLAGRQVGLLFFDSSLRTRVSMEVAISKLGGHGVVLDAAKGMWPLEFKEGAVMDGVTVEHAKEAAGVLGRYVDLLGVRAFPKLVDWREERQERTLEAFARWSGVPVLSLEGATSHPCQALADALTIRECLGHNLAGKTLTVTWAYHPKPLPMAVPNAIVAVGALLGMNVRLAHPPAWALDPDLMSRASAEASSRGGSLKVVHEMDPAFEGSHVVYAKSWGSGQFYGRWDEEKRLRDGLKGWRVSPQHMRLTSGARFMHCLPVRRNVVVDDAVLDSPESVILQQAGNRVWAQQALLLHMLGLSR
ncbi:MAG: N-acetylornithine carbamoyltransferase [Planctomycetota bacterium]